MKIIIDVIATFQIFAAGMYFKDQLTWANGGWLSFFKTIIITLSICLLGIFYVFAGAIVGLAGFFYHKIYNKLHLGFIVKYIVLKHKIDFTKKGYDEIKTMASNKNPKWYNVSDLIFLKVVKWIDLKYTATP